MESVKLFYLFLYHVLSLYEIQSRYPYMKPTVQTQTAAIFYTFLFLKY